MAIQIPDANAPNAPVSNKNARDPAGNSGEISELQERLRKLKDKKTKLEAAMRESGGTPPPKLIQDHRKVCQSISAIETSMARLEESGRGTGEAPPQENQRAGQATGKADEAAVPKARDKPSPAPADGRAATGRRRFDRYEAEPDAQSDAGLYELREEDGTIRVTFGPRKPEQAQRPAGPEEN